MKFFFDICCFKAVAFITVRKTDSSFVFIILALLLGKNSKHIERGNMHYHEAFETHNGDFLLFKLAAVRHLGFEKCEC